MNEKASMVEVKELQHFLPSNRKAFSHDKLYHASAGVFTAKSQTIFAYFQGDQLTADAGALLLWEVHNHLGLIVAFKTDQGVAIEIVCGRDQLPRLWGN
jgi:hypothetical protein